MSDEVITKVVDAMRAKPRKGKGAVYRWLWAHHGELVKAFAETGAGWDAVSSAMCDAGVVGSRGRPPTRKSLPKVWARVIRDKAVSPSEAASHGPRRMPSRLPPSSRPSLEVGTPTPPPGGEYAKPDEAGPRRMRVVRSLDEARAATDTVQSEESGPAQPAGVGVLPRAQWPKPFT